MISGSSPNDSASQGDESGEDILVKKTSVESEIATNRKRRRNRKHPEAINTTSTTTAVVSTALPSALGSTIGEHSSLAVINEDEMPVNQQIFHNQQHSKKKRSLTISNKKNIISKNLIDI